MPNLIKHQTFMGIAQVIRFYFIVIAHVIRKEQQKAVKSNKKQLVLK